MTDPYNTPPAYPTPSADYPVLTNDSPLSYRGRFGRLSFLAWLFLLGVVSSVVFGVFAAVSLTGLNFADAAASGANPFGALGGGTIVVGAVLYIALLYFNIIFSIRRLHDLNLSGWWILFPLGALIVGGILSLISPLLFGLAILVSVAFWLYQIFAPGTKGANRFGPQRVTPGWEVVVGWIYVALFVSGIILGATAISKFASYVAHAKSQTAITQSTHTNGTTTTTTEQTDTSISSNNPSTDPTADSTTTTTTSTTSAS